MSIQISGPVVLPDGSVTAVKIDSGAAPDGQVLTADGAGGVAWEGLPAAGGGLLATGATIGATNERQVFTNGVGGPSWRPVADSTTALQLQNAAGTSVLNVDTTNSRVGIGTTVSEYKLDICNADDAIVRIKSFQGQGDGYSAKLILDGDLSGGGDAGLFVYANGVNQGLFGAAPSGGLNVQAVGSRYINFATNGSDKLRIGANGGVSIGAYVETDPGIGSLIISGNVGIGMIVPGSLLHALLTSAATAAVTDVLTVGRDTTGTAANGFGVGQLFTLESSTTAAQNAARIQALWNDATHATRKADLVLTAYDSGGEREGLRIRASGSAPAIAFLGGGLTPSARKAHVTDPSGGAITDAEARLAINSILVTLEDFGFHATS